MIPLLDAYISLFLQAYMTLYPNRNVTMINSMTSTNDKLRPNQYLDDTGICFGVAITLKTLLREKDNQTAEMVYIYRTYSAEGGDGFEDTLVHSALLFEGRYYDAVNSEGVKNVNDLWFIRSSREPDKHYAVHPERGDTGSRELIPNKITPELYALFEKNVEFTIPRLEVFK